MTTDRLSTGQAARLLGISAQRVHQLAASGTLAFELTPLGRLFTAEEVERYRQVREAASARRQTAI